MQILIGADPEWFLTNGKHPVSAIGKFGGSKFNPLQIEGMPKGFAIQEDNVTVEYNIPPAHSAYEWVDSHQKIQDEIKVRAKAHGLSPLIVGSVIMPEEELQCPAAWIFGCEPDFNAWSLKVNPAPKSENPFLRSAGGHIHIAFQGNKVEKIELVRLLDLCVGMLLMLVDDDIRRMELYGKAGALRFKKYGVEYRTPSNVWTKTQKHINFVWNAVASAINLYEYGVRAPKEVEEIINTRDKNGAKALAYKMGLLLP